MFLAAGKKSICLGYSNVLSVGGTGKTVNANQAKLKNKHVLVQASLEQSRIHETNQ